MLLSGLPHSGRQEQQVYSAEPAALKHSVVFLSTVAGMYIQTDGLSCEILKGSHTSKVIS